MATLHQAIARFLNIVAEEMVRPLSAIESEAATVTWNSEDSGPLADLQWFRATSSGDRAIFFGADSNTWATLGTGDVTGDLTGTMPSWVEQPLRSALETLLGPEVIESDSPAGEIPPETWSRVAFDIQRSGQAYSLLCVLSPELETALENLEPAREEAERGKFTTAYSPNGILMHVEVPVSVSFGRTRIPMRELLNLNSGSIVELDQALGDKVELRVNNHVIALGEVVAVEGNYGVRIVELVSDQRPAMANESTR